MEESNLGIHPSDNDIFLDNQAPTKRLKKIQNIYNNSNFNRSVLGVRFRADNDKDENDIITKKQKIEHYQNENICSMTDDPPLLFSNHKNKTKKDISMNMESQKHDFFDQKDIHFLHQKMKDKRSADRQSLEDDLYSLKHKFNRRVSQRSQDIQSDLMTGLNSNQNPINSNLDILTEEYLQKERDEIDIKISEIEAILNPKNIEKSVYIPQKIQAPDMIDSFDEELERRQTERLKELRSDRLREEEESKEKQRLKSIIDPKITERIVGKSYIQILREFHPGIRLSSNPDLNQIKNGFKRALAKYHPDKILSSLYDRVEAEIIYQQLQTKYENLQNSLLYKI